MDAFVERFERELQSIGGHILEHVNEDTLRVSLPSGEAVVSLNNLRRDVERDGDFDVIAAFVRALPTAPRGVPDWPQARSGLRWAFESTALDLSDVVHQPLTAQLAAVLCYTDPSEALVTFLSASKLAGWEVSSDEATRMARDNMSAILEATDVEIDEVRGAQLGMLSTHSIFKASLLLAPSLKARVAESIGWPLYAVAPCRDFIYLFADRALIAPMARTVIREHTDSGYPLTTEVLQLDDDGLTAIGAFGAKGT